MACTLLVTCLVSFYLSYTHAANCNHDWHIREFTCSIDARNLVTLHLKLNGTLFRSNTSSLYMKIATFGVMKGSTSNDVYNCTRNQVPGTVWFAVDCTVWDLKYLTHSDTDSLEHKMSLIEKENSLQSSRREIVLDNQGKSHISLDDRDKQKPEHLGELATEMNRANQSIRLSRNTGKHFSGKTLLAEKMGHNETIKGKGSNESVYRNNSNPVSNGATEYTVWSDPHWYKAQSYSCQCKNYYRIIDAHGVASYDRIDFQWRIPSWLFYEEYILSCTSESSKQRYDVTPFCSRQVCKKTIEHLSQCTDYKVCIAFKGEGNAPTCIDIKTKCVLQNTPVPAASGGDSLRVEMKISLGAMGGILLAACLVVALTRLRRKQPRNVVEQLIEPRASTSTEGSSLENGENGYCVILPIDHTNFDDDDNDGNNG